jgi:ubiquinol-cytochrome c reductase iron-sulfur subunit
VFRNVPAPRNLEVPPYSFAGDDRVIVGVDPNVANT